MGVFWVLGAFEVFFGGDSGFLGVFLRGGFARSIIYSFFFFFFGGGGGVRGGGGGGGCFCLFVCLFVLFVCLFVCLFV